MFCSGKVYYDLRAERKARGIKDLPLVRIAQLYPFPHDDFQAQIERYKNATEIVWCQEEPRNQGAWHRIQHYLLRHLLPHQKLIYAGRDSSASPAAGYKSLHDEQQKELVDLALTLAGGSEPRVTGAAAAACRRGLLDAWRPRSSATYESCAWNHANRC